MKSILEMLKPRESVFSDTVRDDVLNLSDFAEDRIDKERFFDENFQTQGMGMLFDIAFKRFKGETDTGVIKLTQATVFTTKEPSLRFICIDPTGERKTGPVVEFIGSVPVKYGQRMSAVGRVMELRTNPCFEIRYTTDGSEPKENGGIYTGEIVLPNDCKYVRTAIGLSTS